MLESLLTAVSDTDFYTLSCGSLHFVLHEMTGSQNYLIQRSWFAISEFRPVKNCWIKLPGRKPVYIRDYQVKEHYKLDQKQVSKVTLHFFGGHLSRKQSTQ